MIQSPLHRSSHCNADHYANCLLVCIGAGITEASARFTYDWLPLKPFPRFIMLLIACSPRGGEPSPPPTRAAYQHPLLNTAIDWHLSQVEETVSSTLSSGYCSAWSTQSPPLSGAAKEWSAHWRKITNLIYELPVCQVLILGSKRPHYSHYRSIWHPAIHTMEVTDTLLFKVQGTFDPASHNKWRTQQPAICTVGVYDTFLFTQWRCWPYSIHTIWGRGGN